MIRSRASIARCGLLIATSCGILVLVDYVFQEAANLRRREFIERQYAPELAVLEAALKKWPEPDLSEESGNAAEIIKSTLTKIFDDPIFFSVTCSFDGHHGARSLKAMPEDGYGPSQWLPSLSWNGRHLSRGKSVAGTDLLIYSGWLANAPVMHEFRIVFRMDQIDRKMNQ